MKKKVTPKGFDEASRTTRVKMYKSGKQWVQCLLTRLGMIKLSSGVKPEEVRVETNLDSKTTSLLKGVLAASALIGGGGGRDAARLCRGPNVNGGFWSGQ